MMFIAQNSAGGAFHEGPPRRYLADYADNIAAHVRAGQPYKDAATGRDVLKPSDVSEMNANRLKSLLGPAYADDEAVDARFDNLDAAVAAIDPGSGGGASSGTWTTNTEA